MSVQFTMPELQAAFPDGAFFYNKEEPPTRAVALLPRAMSASFDLINGTLTTSISAEWSYDAEFEFTSSNEANAREAIARELLPQWLARGFIANGEGDFEETSPGAEPICSLSLSIPIQTLEETVAVLQWISEDAEIAVSMWYSL